MNAQQKFTQRAIDGAKRYATADRSDPFALRRALAHIRSGIVSASQDERWKWLGTNLDAAMYDAEPAYETRTLEVGTFSDGSNTYQVQTWRNIVRP